MKVTIDRKVTKSLNRSRSSSAIKMAPAEKAELIEYYDANTEKKRWRFLIKEAAKQSVVFSRVFYQSAIGTEPYDECWTSIIYLIAKINRVKIWL